MNNSKFSEKHFTLRQANQMLPLVQSITTDIVKLNDEVQQTRERLNYLNDARISHPPRDDYSNEVASIEKSVDEKSGSIDAYINELTDLDLRPVLVRDGFVDFPARRKDERVCLCWRLGESDVRYWHRMSEDCGQRKLVDLDLIRQSGDHAFV